MEGIEKIKGKIIQDAENRANEILDKARSQADEIIAKAKVQADIKAKELSEKSLHAAREKKRIINSMVELDMRKEILAAKQEVIEKVFGLALERLNNLEKNKYEEVILNMLMTSVETGDEEIIMSEAGKSKLSPEFINKANDSLGKRGKVKKLSISKETRDISGGFILLKKGVEINNSFEAILRTCRDEIEPKVAEILFQ